MVLPYPQPSLPKSKSKHDLVCVYIETKFALFSVRHTFLSVTKLQKYTKFCAIDGEVDNYNGIHFELVFSVLSYNSYYSVLQ